MSGAVYRRAEDPGPKHARWPEINVAATARMHGLSKSQLARLLNGDCRQLSVKRLELLAEVLGKSRDEVWDLYCVADQGVKGKKKAKARRRK